MQVTFNIGALGFGDVFNCVLLALELPDLFPLQGHLLLQLHNLLLKVVDSCLEAEWLLRAHGRIRLTGDCGPDACEPTTLYLATRSEVLPAHSHSHYSYS